MEQQEHIVFSETRTNKILTKYFAYKCEGLFYFEINSELKEQISLMKHLAVMASGSYIQNFYSIKITLVQPAKAVFIIPNVPPDFLTADETFIRSYHAHKQIWYVEHYDTDSLKHSSVIHYEEVFIEVLKDCFFFNAVIYENKYFSSTPYSNLISFDAIGL